MVVTCPASGINLIDLLLNNMVVNAAQPGPVSQTLTCSANAVWTNQGTTVTQVSCTAMENCRSCIASDLDLVAGTVTPTATTPALDATNCLSMVITCPASSTKEIDLLFNGVVAATKEPGPTTTTVTCSSGGAWMFNGMTTTLASCNVVPTCRSCLATNVALIAGTVTPTTATPTTNAQNCLTMVVTCPASSADQISLLFGTVTATTMQPGPVTGTLTCSATGTWNFQGTTTTQASCTVTKTCKSCLASDITLTAGALTPTAGTPTLDATGCLTMAITCPVGGNDEVDILFGGTVVGMMQPGPITRTVTCNANGQWNFQGTVTTVASCARVVTCRSCVASSVTLTPGTITPTAGTPTTNAQNCLAMPITCPANRMDLINLLFDATTAASMQPGPATQSVTCSATGMWQFNAVTVSAASCQAVKNCKSCTLFDITLIAGVITPTAGTPVLNAMGCWAMPISCVGTQRKQMFINGNTPLGLSSLGTITNTFTCNASGQWGIMILTVSIPVTSVECRIVMVG
uniref:C6 domain-containing protein n=1 Tax=Panagrolaimus sp. JU765 TaxID=591449 RepID=A0AC34R629_9BILA